MEQTYNLHTAEKKKRTEDMPTLKRVDYQSGDVKKQISNTAKSLIKSYRFQSVNEYRALLSLYGLTVEEVKGEAKGKGYNGLVYSALDDKGEKAGNPIKASAIGKSVGYDALQSRVEYSAKYMKENKVFDSPKLIVRSAIENYTGKQNFMNDLARNGLSAVFRENEEGRIYGATFIDHQNKTVFNGSKMGKEFSANIFNQLLKDDNNRTKEQLSTKDFDKESTLQDKFAGNTEYNNQFENDNSILMPSLLEQHGVDYEEEAFIRRIKIEEKKRRRSL